MPPAGRGTRADRSDRPRQGSARPLMVRALLFDLDDTLFDHRRSARAALTEVHRVTAADRISTAFERAPHRSSKRCTSRCWPGASGWTTPGGSGSGACSTPRHRAGRARHRCGRRRPIAPATCGAARRSTARPTLLRRAASARAHRHRHQQPARGAAGQAAVLRPRRARRRAGRVGGRRRLEARPRHLRHRAATARRRRRTRR